MYRRTRRVQNNNNCNSRGYKRCTGHECFSFCLSYFSQTMRSEVEESSTRLENDGKNNNK